tara:strand:+ start:1123 stop:1338 length:216 start_codon:yes stop_codon:yes gene_type:complete
MSAAAKELNIGDMVRIDKAVGCVGFVVDISDKWTPSRTHHAKVFWIAGDYADAGAPVTWVPLSILECISEK